MGPLGTTQRSILQCLIEHGQWHPRCGWVWGSASNTARILDTLMNRELARTKTIMSYGAEVKRYVPMEGADDY